MKKIIPAIVLGAISSSAMAFDYKYEFGEEDFEPTKKYIEVLVGQSDTKLNGFSDESDAFGIRFGSYINDHIAIEAAYVDQGSANGTSLNNSGEEYVERIDSVAIRAGVKAEIALDEKFSVFARTGFGKWDLDASIKPTMTSVTQTTSEDGIDLYIGFGADVQVNEDLTMGLEYVSQDMEFSNAGETYEVNNASVNLLLIHKF